MISKSHPQPHIIVNSKAVPLCTFRLQLLISYLFFFQKSFKRKIAYDWSRYSHLLVRCRGDGRAYQFIAHMDRYFDLNWHDNYSYALFTRGGPYWQTAMVITFISKNVYLKKKNY